MGGVALQDSRCDDGTVLPCRGSSSPGQAGKTLESPGHLTEGPGPPRAGGSSRSQGNHSAGPRAPGSRVWPCFLWQPRLLGLVGTHIQPGPLCLQLLAELQAGPPPRTHPPTPACPDSSCPPGPEPSVLAISRSKVQAWPELLCAHKRSMSESGRWVPAPRGLRPPAVPPQALGAGSRKGWLPGRQGTRGTGLGALHRSKQRLYFRGWGSALEGPGQGVNRLASSPSHHRTVLVTFRLLVDQSLTVVFPEVAGQIEGHPGQLTDRNSNQSSQVD